MPSIDGPRDLSIVSASVTPLLPMRAVDDFPLVLQVRRIGRNVQLRSEVHACAETGPLVVTMPLIPPGVALQLAKALIDSATGLDCDLSAYECVPE